MLIKINTVNLYYNTNYFLLYIRVLIYAIFEMLHLHSMQDYINRTTIILFTLKNYDYEKETHDGGSAFGRFVTGGLC